MAIPTNKKYDELTKEERSEVKRMLLLQMGDSVPFRDYCNADEIVTDEQSRAWLESP